MPNYYHEGRGADWLNSVCKAALVKATYTPDYIGDTVWADVSADECSGTGYTAGGLTLTNVTITTDSVALTLTLDADDPVWDPVTVTNCGWLVVYDETVDVLICAIDCRTGDPAVGRDVTTGRIEIQMSTLGFNVTVYDP